MQKTTTILSALGLMAALWCGLAIAPMAQAQPANPYHLKPSGEPMVIRSFLKDGPARSIIVGFPEGIHLSFDAEVPRVALAWTGDFLDIGPDRGYGNANDRGGRPAIVLGNPVSVGDLGFPFSHGGKEPSHIEFLGYRIHPNVTFYYKLDGAISVEHTVSPASQGQGLTYHFKISGATDALSFRLNSAQVNYQSDKGQQRGSHLLLSSDEARDFSIHVFPRKN